MSHTSRGRAGSAKRRVKVEAAEQKAPVGFSVKFMRAFIDDRGDVVVKRVADDFGMSQGQLADTVGLARQTFYKAKRVRAAKTQNRMKEMLEIVSRVSQWAGGKTQAMAWYRSEPLAAFDNRTAEALVKSGHAASVRDYLDQIALGGFA